MVAAGVLLLVPRLFGHDVEVAALVTELMVNRVGVQECVGEAAHSVEQVAAQDAGDDAEAVVEELAALG